MAALFDLAAGRPDPIPFYGELGSVNPVVITEAAMTKRAGEIAEGLAASFALGSGQLCTKPGVVFVPSGTDFARMLGEETKSRATGPMLNDRIHDSGKGRIGELSAVAGMRRILAAETKTGQYVEPTVLAASAKDFVEHSEILGSECFGPVTMVVEYRDPVELAAGISTIPGSLTGTGACETLPVRSARSAWRGGAGSVLS